MENERTSELTFHFKLELSALSSGNAFSHSPPLAVAASAHSKVTLLLSGWIRQRLLSLRNTYLRSPVFLLTTVLGFNFG